MIERWYSVNAVLIHASINVKSDQLNILHGYLDLQIRLGPMQYRVGMNQGLKALLVCQNNYPFQSTVRVSCCCHNFFPNTQHTEVRNANTEKMLRNSLYSLVSVALNVIKKL